MGKQQQNNITSKKIKTALKEALKEIFGENYLHDIANMVRQYNEPQQLIIETENGLPSYINKQLELLRENIEKRLTDPIEKCPRMTAFHTENNVLEKKIGILQDSEHHKWLLSKFMSQMLTSAFKTFSFKITPIEYALASCKKIDKVPFFLVIKVSEVYVKIPPRVKAVVKAVNFRVKNRSFRAGKK